MTTKLNLGGISATITQLDGMNYFDWKFDISMALRRTGSWKVVSGEETKPTDKTELAEWEAKAEDGLSLIALSVATSQKQYIRDATDGPAAWAALKAIYEKNSTSTRVSLKRRFFAYRHNIKHPISDYITDITSLASQLKAIGVALVDQDITDVLIYALAPEYSDVATALMTRSDADKLKVSDVSAALTEAEARRKESEPDEEEEEATSFVARAGKVPTCSNCRKTGHQESSCWAKGGGKERKCYTCGKHGHLSDDCSKNQRSNFASDLAY